MTKPKITNLDELLPLLRDVTTAKELGAAVIAANVRRGYKIKLALAARDALERPWTDNTVREWLKPRRHTEEWRKANRVQVLEASRRWYEQDIEATLRACLNRV